MRILQVVPTYLPATRYGGPIFSVHSLSRALVARGHSVEVFTTNIDGASSSPVRIGVPTDIDGVSVTYFHSPLLRRLSWAPALAHELKVQVRNFDVVHLNSVFLWPTWAAARASRSARLPYVISPRGMLVKELIQRRHRLLKSAWLALFEQFTLEHAHAIHVTSELEGAELKRFAWQLPPVVSIANGVEEPEAPAGAPSSEIGRITAKRPMVLYLGRLSWKKGLDRLLTAFGQVENGALAIVGPDDERLTPHLLELATKLGIRDRVEILPRTVLSSDKEHLFARASLLVLPSYSENFGNSVLEAMRRGIPVVVTRAVGAAEAVRRSGGGLVVGEDPAELAVAIGTLVEDAARASAMGECGRRYALAEGSWAGVAAEMEALYQHIQN
jgi:glycosyltransferase involved in cell wall biosynthesis